MLRRRIVLIGSGGLLASLGALSALASSEPTIPTTCESGIVVDRIPGADSDPAGVGPVVVDSALSRQLYGESVNVLDGISEQELPVVEEVASKIKFCRVETAEGDYWEVFMPR
jgi:hypothetical protein